MPCELCYALVCRGGPNAHIVNIFLRPAVPSPRLLGMKYAHHTCLYVPSSMLPGGFASGYVVVWLHYKLELYSCKIASSTLAEF